MPPATPPTKPTASGGVVDVAACDARTVLAAVPAIVGLYREVFGAPPWNEDERRVTEFTNRLRRDTQRPGFGAWTARQRNDQRLLGFLTAWPTGAPFPTGRAYDAVASILGPRPTHEWLVSALEVDELAVAPAARGRGIGRRLLDAALNTAPAGQAWLLTWAYAGETVGFYQRRGWHPIPDPAHPDAGVVVFLSPDHRAIHA